MPRRFALSTPLRSLVLALWLVLAQGGFLLHAAEHQFHAPDSICFLCIAAEQNGNGIPAVSATPLAAQTDFFNFPAGSTPVFFSPFLHFQARAPPA
jgi:hypothetical protein